MTNIIQFPMMGNSPPAPDPPSPSLQPPHLDGARGKAIISLVKGVWVVTVLVVSHREFDSPGVAKVFEE